jgi:hypothetical protein
MSSTQIQKVTLLSCTWDPQIASCPYPPMCSMEIEGRLFHACKHHADDAINAALDGTLDVPWLYA